MNNDRGVSGERRESHNNGVHVANPRHGNLRTACNPNEKELAYTSKPIVVKCIYCTSEMNLTAQ